jgi:hypothetical protein
MPIDEAHKDHSFVAFRKHLLDIVHRRDGKALLQLIHRDTKISFGGSEGPDDFVEWWHPEDPKSKLWNELATILAMGGAFGSEGKFEAPYISARWPQNFDAFEYSAITGKAIPCYPTPDQRDKPIRILSFDIVKTSINDSNFEESKRLAAIGWSMVELFDGKIGYVRSINVRSAVGQRIYFAKGADGQWFIWAFIAGD